MNEGENTGMPKSPDFSSPNTPPQTPPQASAQSANPAVFAAAANLPDNDPSQPAQAITSAGAPMSAGQRSRFGFGRKFKDQQPQQPRAAQPTAFNNAPDYFNAAVGDIVIADEAAAANKQKRKKIALIAIIALVVLGAIIGVILLLQQISKPTTGSVRSAFNRYANYILYGEEKDSDIGEYNRATRYTIMDKYITVDDAYNKHFKELFDKFYAVYNTAAENGLYEKGALDGYKETVYDVYNSFEMEKSFALNDVIKQYSENGENPIIEKLDKEYSDYKKDFDSDLTLRWHEYSLQKIELAKAYYVNGCIVSGAVDKNCSMNDGVKNAIASVSKTGDIFRDSVTTSRVSIIKDAFLAKDYYEKK